MMAFRAGSIGALGLTLMVFVGAERRGGEAHPVAAPVAERVAPDTAPVFDVAWRRDAFGRSGALRTWQAMPGQRVELPLDWRGPRPLGAWYRWVGTMGTKAGGRESGAGMRLPLAAGDTAVAPTIPGVYALEVGVGEDARMLDGRMLIVQVPFRRKEGAYLQGYFIGRYPTEGQARTDRYAPPEGFIEVTRENQDLQLSEHFKLREFLTKDQKNVWPKYVVVDPRLIEKLELVMAELNASGIRADRMVVMSGFRTPQYNRRGLNQGRATLSRHQYGDAADVWIDNDGDWYIDDLNRDGRRDTGDVRVMLRAVEKVEAKYPDLVGGAGIYAATSAHGPFIHIDVRGRRARW